jgi:drug/metabolite transporter (DMT)-like permease
LLGIFPTGLAAVIYFNIINRTGPSFLSNINYLIPVVAYFVGALVLDETILWHDLLALILIIFGIVVSRRVVT